MIREYRPEDKPHVLALLKRLHAKSPYAGIPVDWRRVTSLVDTGMDHHAIFVSCAGEKLHGFIICGAKLLWWNQEYKIGSDIFFYSQLKGEGVLLLKQLIEWCHHKRCTRIECGISSFARLENVAPIYMVAGFQREGSLFVMTRAEMAQQVASCQA